MIKNKWLIVGLVVLLVIAFFVSFLLMRNDTKTLKPGDRDPETGCVVGADGRGLLCN